MYQRQVSFGEAIKMALQQNYCNFNGRASRSEYWWFCLFTFIISVVIGVLFGDSTTGSILSGLFGLAFLLPSLGLGVRRLHDTNRSGWWMFLALIPLIGAIVLIYWYCLDSQRGDNQYGPEPHVVEGKF